MSRSRFAVCGAGFWSHYQLSAWREIDDAECIAICDPDRSKADALADRFGISARYADAESMFDQEQLDFVDIISSPASHAPLVRLAASRSLPAICQKPMTESWSECEQLVQLCDVSELWFAIHENWRWQSTLRAVKQMLDRGAIGDVFRCRLEMTTSFDVFCNQPSLRRMPEFIVADLGCHLLDYARCLFGEADSIGCITHRTLPDVAGENVATIFLMMGGNRTSVTIELAYAMTPLEHDCFPQTRVFAEGTAGSIAVLPGYWIHCTTSTGTERRRVPPTEYAWANPQYAIVHSSMVACNQNLLDSLRSNSPAETDAHDNLCTMKLVFDAYAKQNQA